MVLQVRWVSYGAQSRVLPLALPHRRRDPDHPPRITDVIGKDIQKLPGTSYLSFRLMLISELLFQEKDL